MAGTRQRKKTEKDSQAAPKNRKGQRGTKTPPLVNSPSPNKKKQKVHRARRCNMKQPSPNLQTRSKRKESGVTCANNTVESDRLAKVIADFKDSKKKPCSVFGLDRRQRYRDYFFCFECHEADTREQLYPNLVTNRKAERGAYTCTANHKNMIHPTDKVKVIVKRKNLRATTKTIKENIVAKLEDRSSKKHDDDTKSPPAQSSNGDDPGESSKPMSPRARKCLKKYLHKTSKSKTIGFTSTIQDKTKDPPKESTSVNEITTMQAVPSTPPRLENHRVVQEPILQVDDSLDPNKMDKAYSKNEKDGKDFPLHEKDNDQGLMTSNADNDSPKDLLLDAANDSDGPEPSNTREQGSESARTTDKGSEPAPNEQGSEPAPNEQVSEPATDEQDSESAPKDHGFVIISRLKAELEKARNESNKMRQNLKDSKREVKKLTNKAKYWKDLYKAKGVPIKLPKSVGRKDNAHKVAEHIRMLVETSVDPLQDDSLGAQTFFTDLTTMLLDPSLHSGQSRRCAYDVFRQHVRKHIYTPHNVLRQMDLQGGALNFRNIELLRDIETKGKPWQRTLLPSTSVLQDYAKQAEKFGENFCPFRMFKNKKDGSEGFAFRAADVIVGILMAGDVLQTEALLRSIKLAQSMDGALFTKNLGHTLGGLKFNDESSELRQSRNGVFPVLCVCTRESKGIIRGIFYRMIKEIQEAADFVVPRHFGVEAIVVSTNCDMSCEWKLAARSGAARQVTYPCAKCAVKSGALHLQSQPTHSCSWCQQLGHLARPNWICRHHQICTKEVISQLREEVDLLMEKNMPKKVGSLEEVWMSSNLTHQVDPRNTPTPQNLTSTNSIHFKIETASPDDRRVYSENLTHDLVLRNMDYTGSLQERQCRLMAQHIKEWHYFQACQSLSQFEDSQIDSALVLVMDVVPCILHMENRMGILILSLLAKVGLSNAKTKKLRWMTATDKRSQETRIKAFVDKMNKIMNT